MKVTQQNAALVEEAAAAAESLEEQAQNLAVAVSVFKLDKTGLGKPRIDFTPACRPNQTAMAPRRTASSAKVAAKPAKAAAIRTNGRSFKNQSWVLS